MYSCMYSCMYSSHIIYLYFVFLPYIVIRCNPLAVSILNLVYQINYVFITIAKNH